MLVILGITVQIPRELMIGWILPARYSPSCPRRKQWVKKLKLRYMLEAQVNTAELDRVDDFFRYLKG